MIEFSIILIAAAQAALVAAIIWQAIDLAKRMQKATESSKRDFDRVKAEVDGIVEGGKHLGHVFHDFRSSARSFYEGAKAFFRRP